MVAYTAPVGDLIFITGIEFIAVAPSTKVFRGGDIIPVLGNGINQFAGGVYMPHQDVCGGRSAFLTGDPY